MSLPKWQQLVSRPCQAIHLVISIGDRARAISPVCNLHDIAVVLSAALSPVFCVLGKVFSLDIAFYRTRQCNDSEDYSTLNCAIFSHVPVPGLSWFIQNINIC